MRGKGNTKPRVIHQIALEAGFGVTSGCGKKEGVGIFIMMTNMGVASSWIFLASRGRRLEGNAIIKMRQEWFAGIAPLAGEDFNVDITCWNQKKKGGW